MHHARWSLLLVGFIFLAATTLAQSDTCPTIVEGALAATDQLCQDTGRNQACYGNDLLQTEPQPGIVNLDFDEPGDHVNIDHIHSLTLSPMDTDQGVWGVALMRIQANLPNTLPGQNVTFLMFGDVELHVPSNTEPVTIPVTATGGINIRSGPSTSAAIIGSLTLDQTATANGRLVDGLWLRIVVPDDEVATGWVFTELVTPEGDITLLDVVDPAENMEAPLQAFYFRTGVGDAPCDAAPNSGLLIQTPPGTGMILFQLNEVNIQLGSTAYLQAVPGDEMRVNVVEGIAAVEAFGVEQRALDNMRIRIPVDENLLASGPPTPPEQCDLDDIRQLPGGHGDCTNVRIVLDHHCPATIPSRMVVQLHLGAGWRTEAEAQAGLDEQSSQLIIDGRNVPVRRYGVYYSEVVGTYSYATEYDWGTPDPGMYEVAGIIQHGTFNCTVTILEPPG